MLKRAMDIINREASVIALGSVGFGTDISEAEAFGILDEYASLGGNLIDTARVYGDFQNDVGGISERVIGRWLKANGMREHMIISTKGAHPPLGNMRAGRLDAGSIEYDLRLSLDALGTDYVELYFLHRDDISVPADEIIDVMNALVESGRVRAFGASNWTCARLRAANEYARKRALAGFKINQPQWSLAHMEIVEDDTLVQMDKEMYDTHTKTNMPCMPYSSQAKGFFLKLEHGGESALSDKAKRRYLSANNLELYEKALSVKQRAGLTLAEVQLSYLYSQPFPTYPIVGVSSLAQARALKHAGNAYLDAQALSSLCPYIA